MKYKNKHLKNIKEEYENQFNDYRDIDEKEMQNTSIKAQVNSNPYIINRIKCK